jgi:hypothetical protein
MKRSLLLLAFTFFMGAVVAQTVVFHEDFELPSGADSIVSFSSTTNAWAINTTYASQGSRSVHCGVQVGDTTTLTTNSFSTLGNLYVLLEFDHICKVDFFDYAELFVSINNGVTWTKLTAAEYMGTGQFGTQADRFSATSYMDWDGPNNGTPPTNAWWKTEQFNLSLLAGNQPNVKIRFRLYDGGALGGQGAYGWLLDNLKVLVNPDEMVPPVITLAAPIQPDTVYHTGPFLIYANITDFSGVDTAMIVYTTNGGTPDTVGLSPQAGNLFSGEIPSHTFNTVLCYYIIAYDASTNANMGRYPQTGCLSFKVKQAPAVVTIGTATTNAATAGPTYISSATSSYLYSNHISLFTPAELNASGIIESMAWNKANANGYNLGNATYRIYLKHTSMSTVPTATTTFATELSGATLVYENTTQNLPLATGWVNFIFNTPNSFNYNGTDNLMVLVDWYRPGNATGAVNWYYTIATGKAQTWSASVTPPNISYGANNRPNIQIGFQVTNYQYDIGVSQIIEPTGNALAGNNPVRVFLKNHGTDTITKATIRYTYNGQMRPPFNWTGTILPYLSSGSITIGTETMAPGSYAVKAWAELPNDSTDQNPNNDTATASGFICLAVLNGTYTVGNSPTADFSSIGDALQAIAQCGMSGPVVFSLLPGVFQSQMTFQSIPGASATNTITFRSSTLNPDDVIIKYSATGAADNFVLKLDGAKYLRFEYITFKAENSTNGNVIVIGGGSSGNRFIGNKIIGPQVSVNSTTICLVYSASGTTSNDSNNVYRLNQFLYGSYGFLYYGPSTSILEPGTVIDSNSFINQYYRAIDLRYQDAPIISSNYIYSQTEAIHGTTNTYYHGMYLNYCQNDMQVVKNHIHAPLGTYGVYMATCTAVPGREALIANNMIAEIGGFTFVYGFYLSGANYQNYYHNTVNITSPTSNAGHAFFLSTGSNIILLNNIFANTGGAFCVRINAPAAIIRSNYNNLYSVATTNWGWWNGTISNLAMWKSASGVDTNSVSINPGFTSSSNLHVSSIPMNNLGSPVAVVPDDFDWETRSLTTPDIGADEYTPPAKDILFTSVLWPRSSCILGAQEEIELLIRNNGTDPVTTFTATYRINNNPPVTEIFNKNIPPLTTDTLRFTTLANLSAFGLYNFTFYTSLPLDENLFNDTISNYVIFNSHDFYAEDYYTSFEIDDPVRGPYSYLDVNNDNSYWHFFGSTANSRTGMIYMGYECNQSNAGNDWFFSRCFTFEANRTYELSFWYKTSDATYSQSVDVKLGAANNVASMTTMLISLPGFNNAVYQKATVQFTVPATGQYHLGFYAYSPPVATTTQIMACIDDMTIKLIPPFDAGPVAVTSPVQGCGLGLEEVKMKIRNHGTANIMSGLTASYQLTGQSTIVTEPVPGLLLPGDTVEFTFVTPVDLSTLVDTAFQIIAWTSLPGDTLISSMGNDTIKGYVKSFTLPDPPITTNDTVMSGFTATLTAQSSNTVYWYDQPTASVPIAMGNTLITPPLFANTTYYAETGNEVPLSLVTGTGTTGQYNIPFYGYYDYGWSGLLMRYNEMGYIDSIGFDISTTTAGYLMTNQRIFMALVHDSVLTTATKPNPANLTMVFNGSINFTGPGYTMIPLSTPFFYDPDYKLLVYYENQKGSTTTGYPAFRYTTTTQYEAMYRNQSASFPNIDGILTYSKPNVRVYMRQGTGCRSTRVPAMAFVNLPQYDAGVSNILKPMQYAQSGSSHPVKVELKNYGTDPLFQIPVNYRLNSQAVVSQNWNGSLLTGQTDTASFPALLIPPGFSTLKAWTSMPNDAVSLNDTFTINILGTNLQPLPFADNFDGVTQFTPNAGGFTNWELGTPNYGLLNNAHSTPNSWCTNLMSAYYINAEAILTSPLIDFSQAVNPVLNFWMNYNTELGYDGVYVEYSTDNGAGWQILGQAQDTNGVNWYNTINLASSNGPGWSGNSGGWIKASYHLTQFGGMAGLRFRVVFRSNSTGNMEGVCIDDFSIMIPDPVDAAVSGFHAPVQNSPEGSLQPVVVKLKNMGSAPLTSLPLAYRLNQGPVQSIVWNGNLVPGNVAYVTLPGVVIPAGYYTLCAWASAAGDNNTSNDTLCVSLYGKPMYDVAAVQILSPMLQHIQGQSVPVKVMIRNYGTDTLATVPVGYRVNGGSVVTTTYSGLLIPNGVDTVTFPPVAMLPGQQFFCAFTQLLSDFEPANDTTCKMVYVKPLLDIAPVSLAAPTGTACNNASMQVAIRVRNNGADTIHFAQNPCTVNASSIGTNQQVFTPVTVNTGILPPNGEANVVITNNYNMAQSGVYAFIATVIMPGDGDMSNNTLAPVSIGGVTSINTFPALENFESGYNSMFRMQPGQYAGLAVSQGAAHSSQYGLHFQGGNPLGWIGEGSGANATSYQQAWTTNASHVANAASCNIIASGVTGMQLRFDLRQTHSSGPALSWFRVKVNNQVIANLVGDSIFQPATQDADPWVTHVFDLSPWSGTTFTITLQASCKNPYQFAGTPGDNAFVDNVMLFVQAQYDAGVSAIMQPSVTNAAAGTQIPVEVKLENFGLATITSCQLGYKVGNQPPVFETWTGQLSPGSSATYIFSTQATVLSGGFVIKAFSNLAGDIYPINDTSAITFLGIPQLTVPWSDDMEGLTYWVSEGANNSWQLGAPTGLTINYAYSGAKAWVTNLSGFYPNNAEEYLVSPFFDFSNVVGAVLRFYHWLDMQANNDGAQVQYTLNNGQTWINLGYQMDPNGTNWYTHNINGTNCFSGSSGAYAPSTYNLSFLDNHPTPVRFRFRFFSNSSINAYDGWAIDNFAIGVPQVPVDGGVSAILTPAGSTEKGATVNVQVRLKNYGTDPLTNIPVFYQVGNAIPVMQNWTGNLAPGAEVLFTFSTPYIGLISPYSFQAFTVIPGDPYKFNDTTRLALLVDPGAQDLKAARIIYPTDTWPAVCDSAKIILHNSGYQPVTSFTIKYFINQVEQDSYQWTGNFPANDSMVFTFNQNFQVPFGSFTSQFVTILPNDVDITNNNITKTLTNCYSLVEEPETGYPVLHQNVPNPSNGNTLIGFRTGSAGVVRFFVVDLLGRTIINREAEFPAGDHEIELHQYELNTGFYLYGIEFQGRRLVKRMIVR